MLEKVLMKFFPPTVSHEVLRTFTKPASDIQVKPVGNKDYRKDQRKLLVSYGLEKQNWSSEDQKRIGLVWFSVYHSYLFLATCPFLSSSCTAYPSIPHCLTHTSTTDLLHCGKFFTYTYMDVCTYIYESVYIHIYRFRYKKKYLNLSKHFCFGLKNYICSGSMAQNHSLDPLPACGLTGYICLCNRYCAACSMITKHSYQHIVRKMGEGGMVSPHH